MRQLTTTRLLVCTLLCLLIPLLGAPAPARAQPRERCFEATGFCVQDPILAYWEQNGGLAVFGYPITRLRTEKVEGIWTGPVQWFERDRLEDHTAERQGVLAGRLGATILEFQGRPWTSLPQVDAAPQGCRYFAETRHTLCPPFLAYWERNGGLSRFGYPISEARDEAIGAWSGPVQYFERRRMEQHLENRGTPYEILLGLLGKEILEFNPTGQTVGRIVFTSTRSGDQEIWAMGGDGADPINLTNNPGSDDFQPTISANGANIAYVVGTQVTQNQDIWIMNRDGNGKRRLTDNPAADWGPTLSPDGSKVAFVSDRAGNADIFVMNTDGSGPAINLTAFAPNSAQFAPAWSPDGTRIAFVSDENGLPNIWVMRSDGFERYNLTNQPGKRYNNPAWSPDSARIVYEFDYSASDQDIEIINTDGTAIQLVAGGTLPETNPAWSANGTQIAFEQEGDIYLLDLDGNNPLNLTNSPGSSDRDASWGL